MADAKLSALTEATTLTGDEYVYVVDDPAGVPVDRRVTVTNLLGSASVAQPQLYDGTNYGLTLPGFALAGEGAGTFATNPNWTYYTPMILSATRTLDLLQLNVSTAATAGATASLSVHAADSNFNPTSLAVDAGTVAIDSTGVKSKALTNSLAAGRYVIRISASAAVTYLCPVYGLAWKDDMITGGFIRVLVNTASTYSATAPDPGPSVNSFVTGTNGGYALVMPRFSA